MLYSAKLTKSLHTYFVNALISINIFLLVLLYHPVHIDPSLPFYMVTGIYNKSLKIFINQ